MSRDVLMVGEELREYRVNAWMPADPVENKIHEDGLARAMGFRGGLVPGVTVYAWMTHPVVDALGMDWLARGTFAARFMKPVYFGEDVSVRATIAARSEASTTFEVRVLDREGETCAKATMDLPRESTPTSPAVSAYPAAPLPLPAERPLVSRTLLESRTVLGTPDVMLDAAAAQAFLDRVREPLGLYRDAGAPAHPGLYLDLANRTLSRNVRVSPWIHVESQGRHLGVARVGERIEARAKVARLFEKKGHEFVELDILLVADGARPIAAIRHIAIYQLRGASA